MRNELDLRYKRINEISWQGNSEKNKILRQQFAKTLLEVNFNRKTLLNVDETWLGTADFRRFKWCRIGERNSNAIKQVQPRISMIVGLDSTGKVYLSLVQANSNTSMMELYFSTLIKQLDKQDPRWRSKLIILQDNAPYKTSKDMMAFYERHRVPILFTGPHSYVSLALIPP